MIAGQQWGAARRALDGGLKKSKGTTATTVAQMMRNLADRLGPTDTPYAIYKGDPGGFARDVLGIHLWSKEDSRTGDQEGQLEIALAAASGQEQISIASGRSSGKTFFLAFLAVWWINTRPDSVVLTTAPTGDQVRNQVWREIRNLYATSLKPLLGECLTTELHIGPLWFGYGRSTTDADRFRGAHARGGFLLLMDESVGIITDLWTAATGFSTTGGGCWVAAANPTKNRCDFQDTFKDDNDWMNFQIDCTKVPEDRVGDKWLEARRKEWGGDLCEQNPLWRAYVRGLPPIEDEDALVPAWLLEMCANLRPEGMGGRHIGVDISAGGKDYCVALCLDEGRVVGRHRWNHQLTGRYMPTMKTVAVILELMAKWKVPGANVHVDGTGIGRGVADRLRELKHPVDCVLFGAGAQGDWSTLHGPSTAFANRRAELYYSARRLLEEGMLAIPERYTALWAELNATPWIPDNGKQEIALPRKEEIVKDLGRSPDDADALVCALSRPVARRTGVGSTRTSG